MKKQVIPYKEELKEMKQFEDDVINLIECVKQDAPQQLFYLNKIWDYLEKIIDYEIRFGLVVIERDRIVREIAEHLTDEEA